MATFAAGEVVVLPFPFSDLTRSKFRPALRLAEAGRGDWIACQITSNAYADTGAVCLLAQDFSLGGLQRTSFARPGKLFTANESLFASVAGRVSAAKLLEVRNAVVRLIHPGVVP